jgi:hypothetical protein
VPETEHCFPVISTHSLVTIFQATVSFWLQCNTMPGVIIISPDSWNCPHLHQGTRLCELSRWQILACTVTEIYHSARRPVITGKPWNCQLSKLVVFELTLSTAHLSGLYLFLLFSRINLPLLWMFTVRISVGGVFTNDVFKADNECTWCNYMQHSTVSTVKWIKLLIIVLHHGVHLFSKWFYL